MKDRLDELLTALSSVQTPLPQGEAEAFVRFSRRRDTRMILGRAALALVLLLPATFLLHKGSGPAPVRSSRAPVSAVAHLRVPELPAPRPLATFSVRKRPVSVEAVATAEIPQIQQKEETVQSVTEWRKKSAPHVIEETSLRWEDVLIEKKASHRKSSISASFAGGLSQQSVKPVDGGFAGRDGLGATDRGGYYPEYVHLAPISVGIGFDYWPDSHWRIDTGIQLTSYFSECKRSRDPEEQQVWYVGIPVRADRVWHFNSGRSALYLGAGAQVEKGFFGRLGDDRLDPDGWCWSLIGGFGIEQSIFKRVALYFEPAWIYTFSEPNTADWAHNYIPYITSRTFHPFHISFRAGFRFAINN